MINGIKEIVTYAGHTADLEAWILENRYWVCKTVGAAILFPKFPRKLQCIWWFHQKQNGCPMSPRPLIVSLYTFFTARILFPELLGHRGTCILNRTYLWGFPLITPTFRRTPTGNEQYTNCLTFWRIKLLSFRALQDCAFTEGGE